MTSRFPSHRSFITFNTGPHPRIKMPPISNDSDWSIIFNQFEFKMSVAQIFVSGSGPTECWAVLLCFADNVITKFKSGKALIGCSKSWYLF